ncbi:MAG: stage II sporulation protein E [Planctomycetaceae bacterium]|nr:stage II sporulation protein E [Planctomycetaceae bacterium]
MSEISEVTSLFRGDWQLRLDHINETMRRMSMHTEPRAMVLEYTDRMNGLIEADRMLSISRRGVEPPGYLIARDSRGGGEGPDPWKQRSQLPMLAGGILGEWLYSSRPHVVQDFSIGADDPAEDWLSEYRSALALPVYDGGEAHNLVVFLSREPNVIDQEIVPQLLWTTNLFGRATHNLVLWEQLRQANARLDGEMKLIADLQRSLLPAELPRIPTMDLATHYQPAAWAGGDYYDFFEMRDGQWGLFIGDVSGHGAPAAVLMAITHALAHHQPSHATGCCPGEGLAYINERLADRYTTRNGSFVTAFCGVYDPKARRLRYACAGHPPPRVKRCSDGSVFSLDAVASLPLGIVGGEVYETATVDLVSGDQIIFFTDGVTEAFDGAGEMYGMGRLDGALETCMLDASGLIDHVLAHLNAFTAGEPADDDRTVVVAKIR